MLEGDNAAAAAVKRRKKAIYPDPIFRSRLGEVTTTTNPDSFRGNAVSINELILRRKKIAS